MPKTNFSKVEEVLVTGLRKMTVDQIFEDSKKNSDSKEKRMQKKLLQALHRDITFLDSKKHKTLYDYLGLKRQDIKTLVGNKEFTPADWEKLKEIKAGIDRYRREIMILLPPTNDEIVAQERVKHINKRFNVKDKWLPLH